MSCPEEAQKHGGGFADTLHLPKLVGPGGEDPFQGAEPAEEPMGQGVHVHPGQGVGEQQLQHLVVGHALDAVLYEVFPKAAPVSGVFVHVKFSKSFRSFRTYARGNPSSLRVISSVMPSTSPAAAHSS